MSLPEFLSPRDFCTYLETHDYNISSKNFIKAVKNKNSGLLLEELVVRLCRSRKSKDEAVTRREGKVWLEISDLELKQSCFLTPGEIKAARHQLQKINVVEIEETDNSFKYSINGNSLINLLNNSQKLTSLPRAQVSSTISNQMRGTRISDNFYITPIMRMWARNNVPDLNIDEQTEIFIDYWVGIPGTKGIKLNWEATWRNWMRNVWPKKNNYSSNGKIKRSNNGWYPDDKEVRFIH